MELNVPTNDSPHTSESDEEIRQKLANKIYKLNFKSGKSKVWEIFGTIETDTGETIPKLVACKICTKIYNFVRNTTSSLNRHSCYQEYKSETVVREFDSETKKRLERAVLRLTIKHSLPIDLLEDIDMKKFAETLIAAGAKYGPNVDVDYLLPRTRSTSNNMWREHAEYVAKLKSEIKSIRNVGYGLTTAVWSDEYSRTCLFLTIHYVKMGEFVNRYLGMESIKGYKLTSEGIRLATEEILRRFDCTLDDKPTLVTDDSEIMVKAFQANERMYCMNRLLHNALEKAIDDTPDVKEMCEMTNKLFSLMKNSSTTFKIDSTKRRHTILHTLFTIYANWAEIVKISQSHKGEELHIIEHMKLSDIKELIKVLGPFEQVSKELEDEDGPTLHLAIVNMHRLQKFCIQNKVDTDMIKKFKVNLLNLLETHVWKNMTLQHKVALYLFPPANKLLSFSQSDKDLVRAECQRIMQTFVVEGAPATRIAYKVMQIDGEQNIQNDDEFSGDDEIFAPTSVKCIKKRIFEDFVVTKSLNDVKGEVKNEVRMYEETNVTLCDGFNLLQWWDGYKTPFPLLYKTSCKILATPATGTASERAILNARPNIFESRGANGANPESVDELMFLHCNARNTKQFVYQ